MRLHCKQPQTTAADAVRASHQQASYLLGSHAYGQPDDSSNLDVAIDVIVRDPERIARFDGFLCDIAQRGALLYGERGTKQP